MPLMRTESGRGGPLWVTWEGDSQQHAASLFANVVNNADVGMVEIGRSLGFTLE